MDAVGLASGAVEMLKPLPIENLERSFLSDLDLRFSKSRWLMEGKVSLSTMSVLHVNRAGGRRYLDLEASIILLWCCLKIQPPLRILCVRFDNNLVNHWAEPRVVVKAFSRCRFPVGSQDRPFQGDAKSQTRRR
jgi:hypothetical protein